MPARSEIRRPYYFGPGNELFGCLHESGAAASLDRAVVICQSFGQEYIRAHRALVQLASRLATAGIPVLRFDYTGCGDSAGELQDATIGRWLDDIDSAVEDVRRRCAVKRVCLVGLRLGGSLATLAAIRRGDIDTLVLWEPVVTGRRFLAELERRQADMLRYAYLSTGVGEPRRELREVQGFEVPIGLHQDLHRLDLLAAAAPVARRVLLVDRATDEQCDRLLAHLSTRAARCERREVQHPEVWHGEENGGVVPHLVLESIVSELSGERA